MPIKRTYVHPSTIQCVLIAADIPNLDAAKITSGRFVAARLLDGTSGYFLEAQGAGVSPVYALLTATDIPNLDAAKITTGNLRITVANETLRASNDTERYKNNVTAYTKIKETKVNLAVTGIRIKFDMRAASAGVTVHGKLYKNGGAIGTERTLVGDIYTTYSEDFAGPFAVNDLVQLYVYTAAAGDYIYVKNLRIYYDVALNNGYTSQDPA